ncbi:lysophospholipid transporter LplT [Aquabacterium sp.]|uniref:lysophospholipid transporter LplT n=1 Tax=Aquabacterium sp. TaxID=1872578 RepID=UPI002C291F2C|nr:lysophospholipid transporter LplT [Aquabacterium sp.]HSW03850.1 lysophospholipid transporter LplT [Aquabacterium sp.]
MPPGFHRLIAAQFASALADNALLIVAIAVLQEQQLPGWWAPLLKFSFTIAYVVLAPFVGPVADAVPKARLMAWMNGVKVVGVIALLLGLHPALAFAIVGLGAAAYAPAKYGLVTELVRPHQLVAANGWIEVSVVCAALLGTGLGGVLVSQPLRELGLAGQVQALWGGSASGLALSLTSLLLVYGIAAWLNIGIPDSGVRYARSGRNPMALSRSFGHANRMLWRDAEGGLSLAVTTLFWGVGATLQFAVLRWAVDVLGLTLDRAAYLQAGVAVGVVAGAAVAGRCIALHRAVNVLPLGIVLGLLIPLAAACSHLGTALPMLMLVGAVGGLLVVPMNALLQHRGYQLLSAGRSVAVQGFNENLSVLGMLAAYAALLAWEVPIVWVMSALGVAIAAAMAMLWWRERCRVRAELQAAAFVAPR